MQLKIYKDYQQLSSATAQIIIQQVTQNPESLISFASGETPKLTCKLLVELAEEQKADFSKVYFAGLDEWVGISPSNPGSCHYFFMENLIKPLKLKEDQVHLFNALAADLKDECTKMDQFIFQHGGIDLILVGIGLNGHIGLNEPGVSPDKKAHVAELEASTKAVGQKYFDQATHLNLGITLGLQHFMEARMAMVMANGVKKAEIIKKTLMEEVSMDIPATIIRNHKNGYLLIDAGAASLLPYEMHAD